MTTTVLAPYVKQRFVDANGAALFNGTVTTYAAGTTTPITTYKDSTGVATNSNPITLNFRGECDIWLLPNVAYKFVVQDSSGNQIYTIDNIVQSQLLTLYGGVDTGSINAYILNFTANFTSYADGIIIEWIPAHTNTSASTLNVNGLGVVNILNPDGSALQAGQIIANQPATILYKGGAFILTTAATTIYGTFPVTWTGFSVAPVSTSITYRKNGSIVTLTMPIGTGTSNSTSFFITGLTSFLIPAQFGNVSVPCIGMQDNGTRIASGVAVINGATGQITFFPDGTHGNWTAAGAKGFADNAQITYSL